MSKSIVAELPTASRRSLPLLMLLTLSSALLVAASGCRSTSDNQIDLLERELRVQEDYIYELEDYVVEYSEKLRSCRTCPPPQTAAYSEELYSPEPAPKVNKKSTKRRTTQEKSVVEPAKNKSTKDELPEPSEPETAPEFSPADIEVPKLDVELDDPVSYRDDAQPLQQVAAINLDEPSADSGVLVIPDPVDFEAAEKENMLAEETHAEEDYEEYTDEEYANEQVDGEMADEMAANGIEEDIFADKEVETTAALVDRVAERLEVKQLFRGELGEHSPKNLLTVVEALDANNEPVDLNGEVSLMVMSPDGDTLQRLKRWNFTAAETIAAWQSSELGDGLHLELPLDQIQLPQQPLELWVRLVTTDGRKLLTQLPFETAQLSDMSSPQPTELNDTTLEGSALAGSPLADRAIEDGELANSPSNTLRVKTETIPTDNNLQLVESQEPETKSRWRSSMQRTDRPAQGFATTSTKSAGWTTQPLGRQPYVAPQVAGRPQPPQAKTSHTPATSQAAQPTTPSWTSERSPLPATSNTSSRY